MNQKVQAWVHTHQNLNNIKFKENNLLGVKNRSENILTYQIQNLNQDLVNMKLINFNQEQIGLDKIKDFVHDFIAKNHYFIFFNGKYI